MGAAGRRQRTGSPGHALTDPTRSGRSGASTGPRRTGPGATGWLAGVALALLREPALVPVAVRTGLRLAAPGWWRRWPLLPRPAPAYLRFRLATAYGDPAARPPPEDLVAYLRWAREQR